MVIWNVEEQNQLKIHLQKQSKIKLMAEIHFHSLGHAQPNVIKEKDNTELPMIFYSANTKESVQNEKIEWEFGHSSRNFQGVYVGRNLKKWIFLA